MNCLGIDYGEKNIGLAFGDAQLKIAIPLGIVHSIEEVKQAIKDKKINKIIIGLPLGFKGETSETKKVREFAKNFPGAILIDERLTSKMSDDDAGAAALILQTYLDKLK